MKAAHENASDDALNVTVDIEWRTQMLSSLAIHILTGMLSLH
ncbi:hypothetical protein [Alteromonas sp. HB246098]